MEGLCPLHPQQGHCPCTQCRKRLCISNKHYPGEQSNTQKLFRWWKLFICESGAALPLAHGLGGGTPPAGCFASGENDKKEAVRECILSAALFFVFITPVGFLSFLQVSCGKKFVQSVFSIAERVQGRWPCCRGYGGCISPRFIIPQINAMVLSRNTNRNVVRMEQTLVMATISAASSPSPPICWAMG